MSVMKLFALTTVALSLAAVASTARADQMPKHCWIVYDYRVGPAHYIPASQGKGTYVGPSFYPGTAVDAAGSQWYDTPSIPAAPQTASAPKPKTATLMARRRSSSIKN